MISLVVKIYACHVEGLGLIPSQGAILNNQYFLSDQTRISSFLLRNNKEVVRNTTPWVTVTICYQWVLLEYILSANIYLSAQHG